MKRPKLIGLILLLAVPIIAGFGVASGQTFRNGDNTLVASGEVVDSTLWTSGRTIDIAGEVNGDVFCVGQNVTISGKIRGDVICAAQTLRISGTVEGDVRVAAQTLSISSEIKSNLSAASQAFNLESKAKVAGDAAIASENITLNGSIGRDLALTGADATIANQVGRNVKATVDKLTISSSAKVDGQLTYTSANEANIAKGAQLSGQTVRYEPESESRSNYAKVFPFSFGFALYLALSLLALSSALVLLFPRLFQESTSLAAKSPGKAFLTGALATILVPILIAVTMATLIGIPLALLGLGAWLLILALSGPVASYYLGKLILSDQRNPVIIMLAGSLAILFAYFVPIIGFLIMIAVVWMGTGIILLKLRKHIQKPSYKSKKSS